MFIKRDLKIYFLFFTYSENSSTADSASNVRHPAAIIIIVVIGSLLFIVLCITLVICKRCRRKERENSIELGSRISLNSSDSVIHFQLSNKYD